MKETPPLDHTAANSSHETVTIVITVYTILTYYTGRAHNRITVFKCVHACNDTYIGRYYNI